MSPILDIQRTHRRLGKIRMGKTVKQSGRKPYPAKLEQWRLTSPSKDLIAAAADAYQGEVEEWADAPDGRQWQVFTATATLPVLIPPTEHGDTDHLVDDSVFSQHYEMWSAGGCQRRCPGAGYVNEITGKPCECPADPDQREAMAKQGKACKMTTRLSVLLPEVPDIGTWMLESHGYYAATELGGAMELLRSAAPGRMIPAQVRIDQRSRTVQTSKGPETRRYAVPVLELVTVTSGALMAGGGEAALTQCRPPQIGGGLRHDTGGNQRALAAAQPAPERGVPPLPGEVVEEGDGGGVDNPAPAGAPGVVAKDPPAAPSTTGTTDLEDLVALMKQRGKGKAAVKRIYNEHAERLGEPQAKKWDDIVPGPALDAAYAEIDGDGDDPPPADSGPAAADDGEAPDDATPPVSSGAEPATKEQTQQALIMRIQQWAPRHGRERHDAARHALIRHASGGRTSSSREATRDELLAAHRLLDQVEAGEVELHLRATGDYEVRTVRGRAA